MKYEVIARREMYGDVSEETIRVFPNISDASWYADMAQEDADQMMVEVGTDPVRYIVREVEEA